MKYYIALFIVVFIHACKPGGTADLIIENGTIITVDENFSRAEAVAVKDGKVIFVGSNEDVSTYRNPETQIIDAEGLTVLPGLVDAHAHLISLGDELVSLDITGCATYSEVVSRVAERVKETEPGEWIIGGRWDHTEWKNSEFPVHYALSEVSPDNPVYLKRVDGNSALVNNKAMELAGINRDTPDPAGGMIQRLPDGEPSGVLINQAMNLVKDLFNKDSGSDLAVKLKLATDECLRYGLTGVHEAGVGPMEIGVFKNMADRGDLDIRINAMLGEQEKPQFQVDNLADYFRDNRIESYADNMLSVKTIKLFFDGALGSRGAAFFEPYDDDPGNRGLLRIPPEYITEVALAALKNNMSVATHCIGIRGNSYCLDAYEKALSEFPGRDHRFRIEHAQILKEEDIKRFASNNIIPSMQPTHCTSDKNMIEGRIGVERSRYAYAWKSLIDLGLPLPAGSDFPVESVNPLMGIYAAVTRRLPGEPESASWHPEQIISIEEAIKGFTIYAAYASFNEDILGSIEEGKYADFTILDKDITRVEPDELISTSVVYTIVGGKIKYSNYE